jgi:hypothetical protein
MNAMFAASLATFNYDGCLSIPAYSMSLIAQYSCGVSIMERSVAQRMHTFRKRKSIDHDQDLGHGIS